MTPLLAIIDRLAPTRVSPAGEEQFRLRFTVLLVWLASAMALLGLLVGATVGVFTALSCGVASVLLAGVGLGLRRGLAPRAAFWISMAVVGTLFVVMPLGERELDYALVMWLALLPVAAMLFDGVRAGFIGLVVALACYGAMRVTSGVELLERLEAGAFATTARAALFFVTLFLVTASFETLRRSMVRRAARAADSRTYFLASMSHEIRTQMNGVIGIIDELMGDMPQARERRHLELVQRSGRHMVSLINDIIDFSVSSSGRAQPMVRPTAIREIVEDCIALSNTLARESQVVVYGEVADDVPAWLAVDPLRVRQVVMNLLSNAVKYTSRGEVALRVARDGERLVISVADTGMGIAADALDKLFTPFEQAHAEYRAHFSGSGLGLAITSQIVELLGGTIGVASEPGKGSTFTVTLPLEVAAVPAPAEETAAGIERRASPAEVLIVDDNEVSRFVAATLVARFGFVPHVAKDGHEALERMQDRTYAYVLMDCIMPGMDGFEATRRIRALETPRKDTPIIALTASVMPEDRERCFDAGMDTFASKPLTTEVLLAAIADVTKRRMVVATGAERSHHGL